MPRRSGLALLHYALDCRMPWRLDDPDCRPIRDDARPCVSVGFWMGPFTYFHRPYSTRNLRRTQNAVGRRERGAAVVLDLDLARGLWYDGCDGSPF